MNRRNASKLLLSLAGAPLLPAQEGESMKGVQLKNLAPVSKDILRVRLPRPVERKLKNGLPLLVLENHKLPRFALEMVIPACALVEPKDRLGVADATADLLRMGAGSRNSREIAEALSELGATLFVGLGSAARYTTLSASALSDNLDDVLAIVGDVLLRPTFPEDELAQWKNQQLAQLQQARTNPGFLADERFRKALYPDERGAAAQTPESIRAMTRDHLVEFHKQFYKPGNAIVGIAGDVDAAAVTAKLEKLLAGWAAGAAPEPKLPLAPPLAEKRVYLVNRPNSVQTYLELGNRAIGRKDPDYFAALVMNRVLGQGPSARLFRNIREDKGYTYGVYSSFTSTGVLNHFSASSSVRTEVTAAAFEEFLKEFRDIRERPVPADELDRAKRAIVANFALGLEQPATVLNQWLTVKEHGFPADYWDTYTARVMAVTAADVQRVAKKYVPVDNLQVVAVGDAAKIREALAKFAPVEEYSVDGTKIGG